MYFFLIVVILLIIGQFAGIKNVMKTFQEVMF